MQQYYQKPKLSVYMTRHFLDIANLSSNIYYVTEVYIQKMFFFVLLEFLAPRIAILSFQLASQKIKKLLWPSIKVQNVENAKSVTELVPNKTINMSIYFKGLNNQETCHDFCANCTNSYV